MIRPFVCDGKKVFPTFGSDCHIDPSAQIIGDVRMGNCVSVHCCAVLRADEAQPFLIGDNVNIQDGVVIHSLPGLRTDGKRKAPIIIKARASLAHNSIIHGPTIIGKSFIGFGSTVHNSVVGDNVYIGHMALVMNVIIPDFSYIPDGARIKSQKVANKLRLITDPDIQNFNSHVVQTNDYLRQIHLDIAG